MFGLIHEAQSPAAQINWNRERVYEIFGGAPNYWSKAEIDTNVLGTVDEASHNSSEYDPKSIMHYLFECECFEGCKSPPALDCICRAGSRCGCTANYLDSPQQLSATDIEVVESMYPFNTPAKPDTNTPETVIGDIQDDIADGDDKECKFWNGGTIAFFVLMFLFLIALIVLLSIFLRRK